MCWAFRAQASLRFGVSTCFPSSEERAYERRASSSIGLASEYLLAKSRPHTFRKSSCGVLAVNSLLNSYLIRVFSRAERVTMDVGIYHMTNAGGRLASFVLSGPAQQIGRTPVMHGLAAAMVALWALASNQLKSEQAALEEA